MLFGVARACGHSFRVRRDLWQYLRELADNEELVANALKVGQVVAKGGTVHIYTITPRAYPSATEACNRDAVRKKFAEKLVIKVQYESLYSHQQSASFEYIAPVSNCKSS